MQIKHITLFIIVILLSCSYNGYAQQDDKAREILDRLAEHTTSAPSVFVNFTVSMSTLQDDTIYEQFDGEITIRGEKYRLSIMGMEIWFDGTSTYTYMPDVSEVIISDPDENGGLMSNPAELFTLYHEEFRYRLIDEISREGKRLYEIDLHPLDRNHDFHTVKLFIETENNFIHSAVIAGKDGNRYTLKVNDYSTDKQVLDSFFVFDESDYPDLEIIDMRW